MRIRAGDRVRVERDETLYPSKGTWPRFRGKYGTVVETNDGELGVVFGKVRERSGKGSLIGNEPVTWFQNYELRKIN